jgi:hypothetical protein
MNVKLLFLIGLFLSSTVLFQNCAGGGSQNAASADGPVSIVSTQNRVVGLYDLPEVAKVHYYYAIATADLTITINVPTPQASGALYNSQAECVLTPQLSAEQYEQLLTLLPQTSLTEATAPTAAGCNTQYLELTLQDGSVHTYPFQDGCQAAGDVSIVDPQAQLQAILNGIIADASQSCSP